MNHNFRFSLLLLLALSIFSCKDKAVEATTTEAETTSATAEPQGTKFITNATMAKIVWEGAKPAGTHTGTINISEGALYVNDGALTAGSFVIDMNSINVTDLEGSYKTDLETHLKGTGAEGSADFFNVTKYPTAKFEIIEIIGTSDQPNSNATVTGNLTLLDVTKAISFPANISIGQANISVNTNPFSINRTDWGIKYGSKTFFDNLADKFINDDIKLQISLTASLPAAM